MRSVCGAEPPKKIRIERVEALALAADCGFTQLARFQQRKRSLIPLG
jgi:hypothetical protein